MVILFFEISFQFLRIWIEVRGKAEYQWAYFPFIGTLPIEVILMKNIEERIS